MDTLIEVWEAGGIVALCKPPGIPVFPPHGVPDGDCLLARWSAQSPQQMSVPWPAGFEAGIAHRLDTPTSGQVLAARSLVELTGLRAKFAQGDLTKRYRLITARDVPWDAHHVQTPIAHDKRRKSRMVVQRGQSTPHRGKWYVADTRFHRIGPVAGGWLWEAVITTGVMHQIRVHAASVGIPLMGDQRYGGGPPPPGQTVDFYLHHCGLTGPGLKPPELATPDFWPAPR